MKRTYSIDALSDKKLDAYSKRTGVPMGRVIDFALELYLKDQPEGQIKDAD